MRASTVNPREHSIQTDPLPRLRAICVAGLHGHHAGAGRADRRPYPTLRRLALARPRPPNTTAAAASSSRRPTPMPVRASVRPRVADAAPTAAGFVVAAAAPDATTEPGAPNDVRSWAPMTADRLTSVPSTFVEAPDGEDPDSVVPRVGASWAPPTSLLVDPVAAWFGPAWAGPAWFGPAWAG